MSVRVRVARATATRWILHTMLVAFPLSMPCPISPMQDQRPTLLSRPDVAVPRSGVHATHPLWPMCSYPSTITRAPAHPPDGSSTHRLIYSLPGPTWGPFPVLSTLNTTCHLPATGVWRQQASQRGPLRTRRTTCPVAHTSGNHGLTICTLPPCNPRATGRSPRPPPQRAPGQTGCPRLSGSATRSLPY